MPVLILYWSGIVSTRTITTVRVSTAFKFISGVITLISIIGSLITILLGWNETAEITGSIFKVI